MPGDATLLLLDKGAVERLLRPEPVLSAVRDAFLLHSAGEGRVFPIVREAIPGHGVFGIKSGDVAARRLLGFKAAGFWPANRQLGGEAHQATIMLFAPETGRPLCLIDGNAITTMRTGAAGGLGLQQLARPDSRSVCVFGTGVQARIQLSFALRLMPALGERVHYVSRDGARNRAFEDHFADRCHSIVLADGNGAVASSDVVITATPGKGALFDRSAVRPGTHLTCVGADTKGKRELPDGLLSTARLVADDRDQARQIGEAQWLPDHPCLELGEILGGLTIQPSEFRRSADEITVFDMTGLALQDLTVASMVYETARAGGLGTEVAWPW